MKFIKTDSDTKSVKPHKLKDKSILLVEDSKWAQKFITDRFHEQGVKCTIANNGKEALDIIKTEPEGKFDVILSDIEMPVLDGFGFLEQLKQANITNTPKVIMYSSLCDEVSIHKAESLGAAHYVTKYNLDKLLDSIETYSQH